MNVGLLKLQKNVLKFGTSLRIYFTLNILIMGFHKLEFPLQSKF